MPESVRQKLLERIPGSFEGMVVQEQTETSVTRLAENAIQANTLVMQYETWLRVFKDNRVGLGFGSPHDDTQIDDLITDAVQAWKNTPVESPLRPVENIPLRFLPVQDTAIEKQIPAERAHMLARAVSVASDHGMIFTGAYTTEKTTRTIASTTGGTATVSGTMIDMSCTVTHPDQASGWAREFSTKAADINGVSLAVKAGGKAMNGRKKTDLKPGTYTVILEPAAVGSMLLFLGFLSFGGRPFNRGTSFLSGKIGRKVMADHISITDDSSDDRCYGWPFDYEGTPTQTVPLIQNGVACGVVHDVGTATAAGTHSTGHALSPGNTFGPYPRCLKMDGGDTALKDLVHAVRKGVLVTRFWYINYVNPMRTMVTGSTRDGTFLVKNGTLQSAVQDMRFVESILDAFNRSILLSKERAYVRQFGSTLCVPWMVIPDFTFTETL
jgi:PmbA protein